jgi:hypothetical protein
VISGAGNTKLIALSPYNMTLVVMTCTPSILVGMSDCPAVVSVWMLMNPSELEVVAVGEVGVEDELGRLDDAGVDESQAGEDPTTLDKPEVGVLRIDEDLGRLDEVRLTLDDSDALDVVDRDPERVDEIRVGVLRVDEELVVLDDVWLTLDEVDDLDVDDEELLDRVLEDVEFNGGTTVVKTVVVPEPGGLVVGPLGELTERTEVSVKTLVDVGVGELVDDGDGATLLVARVLDNDDTTELLAGGLVEPETGEEELGDGPDEATELLEAKELGVDEGQENMLELETV